MATTKRADSTSAFEAEVIPGLEPIAIDELRGRFSSTAVDMTRTRAGFLRFRFSDRPTLLNSLRSVIAVYKIHPFLIPRPKALLGHQHFTRLVKILTDTAHSFVGRPKTFGIGAAGSESSVMRSLRRELAAALKLEPADDGKGELFSRILPARQANQWEVLVRTAVQPLSKRDYRVDDMPGSLNATVAYAMTQFKPMHESATVINLCSGSSTILIERALHHPQHQLLAVDNSPAMIRAGSRNVAACRTDLRVHHLLADARRTPLPSHAADQLYADLPFGNLVGSHDDNKLLYPAILQEAARLARPNAAFVVLTHEINLMHASLAASPWQAASETMINLRGLHPRLFVLERNSARIEVDTGAKR